MKTNTQDIGKYLLAEIEKFQQTSEMTNVGNVERIGDGIATISGLSEAALGEIIEFPKGVLGIALNLKKDEVGVVIMGDYTHIKSGDIVKSTGRILDIGVSEEILGRIVNPLGLPLDGKPAIKVKRRMLLDKIAPGIITRKSVSVPVQTGIKAIDAMIPIGRGQRELIIGDRGTGKSSIALTTILNQKDQNMKCIYVCVGQKESFVAQLKSDLEKYGAMEYTTIVDASASTSPTLQYIAPLAGCAIGEYFAEKGEDALVIYDDLTKHAWAYRELSLLLRRPTGREAYPGDIFYLHSALLERATRFNEENGGGSLTALPIIETQAGDVSAYIPTNVISITDGQIYLETDLFNSGQKPAINVGASVSRVGSSAQVKAIKKVAGKLKLDLAQYRELAAFAQFASDLDDATKKQITRGEKATEILKQGWDKPFKMEEEVIIFWTVANGYLDEIEVADILEFEAELLETVHTNKPKLLKEIVKEKVITEKIEKDIKEVVSTFVKSFLLKKSK